MKIPERIQPQSLSDYLEVMTRAIFQAGMRWALIDAKWEGFRSAFELFDVEKIASFSKADVDRLSEDSRIIRSRSKIEATVHNAQTLIALDRQFGGFRNYLRSFDSYENLGADIKKRFKFMGELNVYYFLFHVGEQVPEFESWVKTIPGEHPRMQEMVELARKQDSVHKEQ
jgi:DNA-3-methyladenine glycosylase I